MKLRIIPGDFAVSKIIHIVDAPIEDDFWSLARTDEEISLVCRTESVPDTASVVESGWNLLGVEGVLDFSLTGILARISGVLADAGVSIFAVSTFNTDYILVKADSLPCASEALRAAGYEIG